MIKRRHQRSDEIMLIPFLDILCSLIGVLVLIIVVLVVAQTQRINGRTPEELQRSSDNLKLLTQQKENKRINELLKEKVVLLEKQREEAKEKEEKIVKLRKLLDTSTADREQNQQISQTLLKELDNLLVEVNGLTAQQTPLEKQMAELRAEIEKRQLVARKGPPVVVQPGGSGLAKSSKVFFIEASGGKLTFYWDDKNKGVVSAVPEVIATDVPFNAFLKAVHIVPQSKLIFLMRDDGMGAYNLGAGWAQATYNYRVDQVGKLPIPGRGDIDLRMFREFLGMLPPTPPPEPPKI
ncbi:MAG: hypothetical protein JWL59_2285 [Chthoniobacteraceae bacterium]|nr:hypothetical protein [Chthoniobacteraceae bacterium]